jgi:hypothetical protein
MCSTPKPDEKRSANKGRRDNHYQPFSFDALPRPHPQPHDRHALSLVVAHALIVRFKIMPISSVAQILLRIFALNWFLTGLVQIAGMAFTFRHEYFTWFSLAPSAVYFVAGIIVWMAAPKLSRFLAHRNDGEFDLGGIKEVHLYSAVFLALGLYFALSSLAVAFSWMHFFTVNSSPDYGFHKENQPSYYDMSEKFMTLAAGVFLTITCNTWARKLTQTQPKEQGGGGQPATRPESL